MIKHILVPTDGSEQAQIGVDYAVQLAKRSQAVVHGLHVVDVKLLEGPYLRDISASLGLDPYADHQGKLTHLLEERGKIALELVENACKEGEVTCQNRQVTGLIVRSIIDCSDLADVIVMGRAGEHSQWLEGILGSTTEGVARHADRPVLVTGTKECKVDRIVLAYDSSHHAHGAIKAAAALACQWGSALTILTVGTEKAQAIQDEARAYLAPHDLTAEYHITEGDAAKTIVAFSEDQGADLLIVGAYAHNVLHDMILGSTTAYVMDNAPCPLLVAP